MENNRIPINFLDPLIEYGSYYSIPESKLKSDLIQVSNGQSKFPDFISVQEYLHVFERLVNHLNKPFPGINLGTCLSLKAIGLIVQLSLNSSHIEQVLILLQEYLTTMFPLVKVEMVPENGNHFAIRLTDQSSRQDLGMHLLDMVFCFMYREICIMVPGKYTPNIEVCGNRHLEMANALNAKINPGEYHQFIFDQKVLNKPINERRMKNLGALIPLFLQTLNNSHVKLPEFSNKVRMVILNLCTPAIPEFDRVAEHLPMSHRSIQRRLRNEGQSYRKITNQLKKEIYTYLSYDIHLKIEEIAWMLGYSDSSALIHARDSWSLS